jgi:hypothetical protein
MKHTRAVLLVALACAPFATSAVAADRDLGCKLAFSASSW